MAFKNKNSAWAWWPRPVISSTLEAEEESYKFNNCLSNLVRPRYKVKSGKTAMNVCERGALA